MPGDDDLLIIFRFFFFFLFFFALRRAPPSSLQQGNTRSQSNRPRIPRFDRVGRQQLHERQQQTIAVRAAR